MYDRKIRKKQIDRNMDLRILFFPLPFFLLLIFLSYIFLSLKRLRVY